MAKSILDVRGVAKDYGGKVVIDSATFSLGSGEILCLTGPSGIGKSTLLEIAAGVLKPDTGTVVRMGKPSLMFQDDALIPWLNAEAAITYILPGSMDKKERLRRAREWLERFGLEPDTYPAAMSGGMRRRLSLARAFASTRPLILLDEPFAFLDAANQRIVAEEIASHAAKGCAIMLTTHTAAALSLPCLAATPMRTIPVESSPIRI